MRRNPSLTDLNSFVTLGLVVGGGFLFYKYVLPVLQGIGNAAGAAGSAVNAAANTVAAPIAQAYVAATSGPAVTVQGSVILSNGEEVAMQDISNAGGLTSFTQSNGQPGFSFNWKGQVWQITGPHDANGNYAAVVAPFGVVGSTSW